jgi:hypothetical protein
MYESKSVPERGKLPPIDVPRYIKRLSFLGIIKLFRCAYNAR